MTLRELLDDTILRLGLCDRVDLLTVRKFIDGIEAQRAILAAQGLADRLEPEFSPEHHLTPAGGADPYLELNVEYDHEGGGAL